MTDIDLNEINTKIQLLKKTAEELNQIGEDFPTLARNTVRILASIKMLEINISDLVERMNGIGLWKLTRSVRSTAQKLSLAT